MAEYKYKVRDKLGRAVTGSIEAPTVDIAADKLKKTGFTPISIKKESQRFKPKKFLDRFIGRVSLSEINTFSRQFAALQHAGVPVTSSLDSLRVQIKNKFFQKAIEDITKTIRSGESISAALGKYPDIFNPLYTNMIQVGEESGTLAESFSKLTQIGEQEERMKRNIKAAVRYPVMVLVAIVIAFIVLIILVVPRFASIYSQSGVELPFPTRMLIWMNSFITQYWWVAIILVGVSYFTFRKFANTGKGRIWLDSLQLKIPVFGPLFLEIYSARFARVTGILLGSGLPVMRALEFSSQGIGNVVIAQTINTIRQNVSEGKGMSEPMKISGFFTPIAVQMVAVGEGTGKVGSLLLDVADYYDSHIEYTISNFTALIEPLLIFILGCCVLFMALGIFLPMWNLMSLFRR